MAIAKDDAENRNEEIGDCLFLILHIASHFNREKSLLEYIDEAKDKMIEKHKLSNKVKKWKYQ